MREQRRIEPASDPLDQAFGVIARKWLASHGLMAVPIQGRNGHGATPEPEATDATAANRKGSGDGTWQPTERQARSEDVEAAGGKALIELGPVVIDVDRFEVRVEATFVHLTPTELRVLVYLAQHADRVAGHRELLTEVWGHGYEDDVHLLQVTVRSLRARIAMVTPRPIVETVYGAGYRIASFEASQPPTDGMPEVPRPETEGSADGVADERAEPERDGRGDKPQEDLSATRL